ncbi:hypothetical protein [Chryseobacterium wanjuense]|uniref:hypothetical protein n=1 Tax=Chryseobacterium wanjuense TaxID=356305 RepID=UPI00147A715A|nr:hypothetical protein [Chryseobacterium wanjuense]
MKSQWVKLGRSRGTGKRALYSNPKPENNEFRLSGQNGIPFLDETHYGPAGYNQ